LRSFFGGGALAFALPLDDEAPASVLRNGQRPVMGWPWERRCGAAGRSHDVAFYRERGRDLRSAIEGGTE
jgi:hypothetical protein